MLKDPIDFGHQRSLIRSACLVPAQNSEPTTSIYRLRHLTAVSVGIPAESFQHPCVVRRDRGINYRRECAHCTLLICGGGASQAEFSAPFLAVYLIVSELRPDTEQASGRLRPLQAPIVALTLPLSGLRSQYAVASPRPVTKFRVLLIGDTQPASQTREI